MPHRCTTCGRSFPDGSKQMLSGCPECGGNKFQFIPPGESTSAPDVGGGTGDDGGVDAGGDRLGPSDDDIIEAPAEAPEPAVEDRAQASARSSIVGDDELPPPDRGPEPADVADAEGPDLAQLREELNDQFESIRILEPGQYELNLMELYDREEYIVALEEDGRYVIDVPTEWRDGPDDRD